MAGIIDIALQKIRDTAGKLGKNVSSGVTNYINQNTIFANPTSNNGQNYWSSPAAQKLVNYQSSGVNKFFTPITNTITQGLQAEQRVSTATNPFLKLTPQKNQQAVYNKVNVQPDYFKKDFTNDLGKMGLAGAAGVGLVTNPASAYIGAGINPLFEAGGQILSGQKVNVNVPESAGEGFNIGAQIGGTGLVTGPIFNPYINNTAKQVYSKLGSLPASLTRIAGRAVEGGTGFGALGAMRPANSSEERLKNFQDDFKVGAIFSGVMSGLGEAFKGNFGRAVVNGDYKKAQELVNKLPDVSNKKVKLQNVINSYVQENIAGVNLPPQLGTDQAKKLMVQSLVDADMQLSTYEATPQMVDMLFKRGIKPGDSPAMQQAVKYARYIKMVDVGVISNAPSVNVGLSVKDLSKEPGYKETSTKAGLYDATPKGFGVEEAGSVPKTPLEKIGRETVDEAIARKVGYQIDNGRVKLEQVRDGWKATVSGLGDNDVQVFRGYKKDQVLKQTFEKLYPDIELGKNVVQPSSGKVTLPNTKSKAGLYDITKEPIKIYRAEDSQTGVSAVANGTYFAGTKQLAQKYGNVITETTIPKGSKILNFDVIKNNPNQKIIPQEIIQNPDSLAKWASDNGYNYIKNTNTKGVEYVKISNNVNGWEFDSGGAIPGEPLAWSNDGKYGVLEQLDESGELTGKYTLNDSNGNIKGVFNSVDKAINAVQPPSGKVTTDMSGIQNRTESVVNQKTQDITSKLNTEPQTTSINGQSNAQPILALPKPKYEVGTKAELKKVLAKDPNADVKIVMKSSGKVRPMTAESVPDRADVAATIPNRLNNFIEDVLGYSTKEPKGGKREAGGYTKLLRKGQEAITTKVEQGLASDNNIIRNGASILQDFFKGIGMSPERAKASNALKGEIVNANTRAYDVTTTLYDMLPKKGRKASMARINSVLDPELSKTKVTFDDLTTKEKGVYTLIREGLDLVHDTSYANGHISPELYVKNKGNYTPRMYDVMESPPEVNQFLNQGKRIDNSLYKQRGITDEWKQEHNLDNPIYALGKRLAQVETNSAIKRYTDFLATNPNYVSDVAKPGYTKLSNSPAYGSLADKWVLNSAAEDLKGFFFANQGLQNLYDVFRAYDRMGVRQLQKKLLTVFNPTTNVGNIVSDNVFGFLTGVDPATLNKNLYNIKKNPKEFKALNDYLTRKNVTSTDITRTDFVNWLGKIDSLKEGQAVTDNIPKKVQKFYAGTDDAYKVAAFKSLLDKGFTLEEATRKVADGFQNYSNVGKFYDVWAKTPIIGKPFVKFQGDLIRIIKNGVVNNPLGLIGFLGTLKGISILSSKLSGETDEDRKTREDRYASPKIPGLNISLAWQTPWGEFNVARYISPFYANNETTNMASNMIPFVPNIDKDRDVASNIAMNVNDPLVSPFIQLAVNRDFRGKRIADPDANKYQETTLTPTEQLINQGKWFGRAYLPPPANSAIDVASVAGGGTDMYGRKQTLGQSIARLGGIKVTQFGPEEAAEQRAKDAEYAQKGNEYIDKQISTVQKQQLQGKITEEEAKNRIDYLNSQKEGTPTISNGGGGEYKYIDDSDTLRTINTKKVALMPETTEYQKALKRNEAYKLVDNILDSTLSTDKQSEALSDLGISPEQATYYNIARQPNDLKSIYVQEEINNMMSTTKDRGQMLEYLVTLRQEIGGETILTSGVIDYLNDQGLISDSEASYLKRVDSTGGKIKLTGRGSKVTIKKVSLPESSKVTAPKIKDMGDLLKMKGSKVKPKMKKYKLTVYNKL